MATVIVTTIVRVGSTPWGLIALGGGAVALAMAAPAIAAAMAAFALAIYWATVAVGVIAGAFVAKQLLVIAESLAELIGDRKLEKEAVIEFARARAAYEHTVRHGEDQPRLVYAKSERVATEESATRKPNMHKS